jgi:hypothetical protein
MATFQEMWPDFEIGVKRMPWRQRLDASRRRMDGRTLEPNFVTLQALHSLLEESLTGGGHAGNIVLFPFYGRVDRLENLFDGICDFFANTITRDKGHLSRMRSRDIRMERQYSRCIRRHT